MHTHTHFYALHHARHIINVITNMIYAMRHGAQIESFILGAFLRVRVDALVRPKICAVCRWSRRVSDLRAGQRSVSVF